MTNWQIRLCDNYKNYPLIESEANWPIGYNQPIGWNLQANSPNWPIRCYSSYSRYGTLVKLPQIWGTARTEKYTPCHGTCCVTMKDFTLVIGVMHGWFRPILNAELIPDHVASKFLCLIVHHHRKIASLTYGQSTRWKWRRREFKVPVAL